MGEIIMLARVLSLHLVLCAVVAINTGEDATLSLGEATHLPGLETSVDRIFASRRDQQSAPSSQQATPAAAHHEMAYAAVLADATTHFCSEEQGAFCGLMRKVWVKYQHAKQSGTNLMLMTFMKSLEERYCASPGKKCGVLSGLIKALPPRKDSLLVARIQKFMAKLKIFISSYCKSSGNKGPQCVLINAMPATFMRMVKQRCTSPFPGFLDKVKSHYCK